MELMLAVKLELELRRQGKTGRLGNLSQDELIALAEKLGLEKKKSLRLIAGGELGRKLYVSEYILQTYKNLPLVRLT